MNAQLTEIMRLITNLIRTGVVTEVDRENWLCRVKTGELETNWISWLTLRAGNARTWWRPSEGEQVVLLSLGGNLETAFALPAIYSNQFAPPSTSADACVTEHPDGGWFEYEPATGRWYVRGIQSMVIEAADNITLKTSEFVLEADRTRINSEVVINGGVTDLQVPLRDLWNPATCPVSFLPYLAWAFSVDRWDEGWTESVKRQVVKDAFYIHQHKGTTSAVRRVVEPFGFLIRIIEWWQTGETPGTFRLDIGVQDQGITEDTYLELERLISDAKPCSRHMIGMSINLQTSGPHWVGAASYLGEEITIYPYINETIISGGTAHEGGAVHVIDTMRVNP